LQDERGSLSHPRQLGWFLAGRVLAISLFLGGTIFHQWKGGPDQNLLLVNLLALLIGFSYVQSIASALLLPRVRNVRFFVQVQVVWDLVFVFFIIYLTGGIESIFSSLFILIILAASIFLPRRDLFLVASSASILYGSLLDLQFYGYLPFFRGLGTGEAYNAADVFYSVFEYVSAFFLTAFLSGLLVERLRRSQQALALKLIDFEELERLNRTIVRSVPSGMMIVNPEGRIRSFNPAASKITGYSLEEIYDREIREIFPEIKTLNGGEFHYVERDEAIISNRQGETRTLGYGTSLVKDPRERTLGLLVVFQDLSDLKKMEDQLKRSDRLAAAGQLASGMAHEIRNPLASISGSVQLMMESADLSKEDRRLMNIVVREADRLGHILTDFLQFARPPEPKIEWVDVSALLDEVIQMAAHDPRFSQIQISRAYQKRGTMALDRGQIRQAVWNLMINAAEAIQGKGTIVLRADFQAQVLLVEDDGPGVEDGIRMKIFDPFFTTKERGSGLGLALVHTITELHRGHITFTSKKPHGAIFALHFPVPKEVFNGALQEPGGNSGIQPQNSQKKRSAAHF